MTRTVIRRCAAHPEFWRADSSIATASSLDSLVALLAAYEQPDGPIELTIIVDRELEHRVGMARRQRQIDQLTDEVRAARKRIRRLTEEARHS